MRGTLALAGMALVAACAGTGGQSGTGERGARPNTGASLRAGDRAIIPAMHYVRGVAASDRYLFVATPLALGVFDTRFSTWLPPVTVVDGWPRVPVSMIIADPADATAVWFAADNIVYRYRVGFDELTRTTVSERVFPASVFFEGANPAAGLVVGTGASLVRVSPAGFAHPYTPMPGTRPVPGRPGRIGVQSVESVYAQYPTLRDFERLLTRDPSLRSWPVVTATTTPTRSEVWLGTAGGGVYRVDPVFARGQHVPFGLMSDGAGAVTRVGSGVWFGGLGGVASLTGGRGGLTYVDEELRDWRWVDGGFNAQFDGVRVTSIDAWTSSVWVGSDRGVMRVEAGSGNVAARWDDLSGLPSSLVFAVAPTANGVWAGTARGLAFIQTGDGGGAGRGDDVLAPLLPGQPVYALVTRGDTLWIGSELGVMVHTPSTPQPRRLLASETDARLRVPVVALATADSVMLIANANGEVLRLNVRDGRAMDEMALVGAGRVGRVNALAMDARTMWIAGDRGVLVIERANRVERLLAVGVDLPAEAHDVALSARYVWIATADAAVRLRRLDDGTVR